MSLPAVAAEREEEFGTGIPVWWPSPAAREWTSGLVRQLESAPWFVALIAFGSSVRPVVSSSRDLDLLVIFRGDRPRIAPGPVDVDCVLYRMESVERLLSEGEDLLGWAVRFGRPLADPSGFWSDLTLRWSGKLPLPSASKARFRARRNLDWARKLNQLGGEQRAAQHAAAALIQLARVKLIDAGIFPASRPELPGQLDQIGEAGLAGDLRSAFAAHSSVDWLTERVERYLAAEDEPALREDRPA